MFFSGQFFGEILDLCVLAVNLLQFSGRDKSEGRLMTSRQRLSKVRKEADMENGKVQKVKWKYQKGGNGQVCQNSYSFSSNPQTLQRD